MEKKNIKKQKKKKNKKNKMQNIEIRNQKKKFFLLAIHPPMECLVYVFCSVLGP